MKHITLLLFLFCITASLQAQDTISTIRVKKNRKAYNIEGIATIGGMYYGKMHLDAFLEQDRISVSQDSGKLTIISFTATLLIRNTNKEFKSLSAKIPPALKEAIQQGGSRVQFENIVAQYADGATITLNPVIIKLYDAAAGSANIPITDQSSINSFATVAGLRDGYLERDSLLNYDGIMITGNDTSIALSSYDVSFLYNGQYFTLTSTGTLPADLKKLLAAPRSKISQVTFENIKAKRNGNGNIILNPVIIRLRS